MKKENEEWKAELFAFVDEAEKNGKWLKCNYQDLIFTPDELREKHKNNQFVWGVVNWKAIDPIDLLKQDVADLLLQVTELQKRLTKIKSQ